ncbi:MAG: HD-GYP domain-containing protein [Chloroflexi bacterium]|nr:HD-GYP domain-containing protein [Chloroflexota bacterium]
MAVRRATTERFAWSRVALPAAALALPLLAFATFRRFPATDIKLGSPASHFYIVSVVAALALVMAAAVIWAARRLPDARTFFLAMGFVSMATIFLAHGLGTSPLFSSGRPGQAAAAVAAQAAEYGEYGEYAPPVPAAAPGSDGGTEAGVAAPGQPSAQQLTARARGRVVGYSAQLSFLVSAIFFALAAIDLPARAAAFVLKRRLALLAALTVALAGHVVVALRYPQVLADVPLDAGWLKYTVAATAIAGFAFAGWRFLQAHRLAMLPLQGAMALGMAFLIEAQLSLLKGTYPLLSWWEYHFVMLLGFSICVLGLLRQYRVTGDLGAVVEGLFLRRQITGLRDGDPRALVALGAAVAAKDTETAGHIDRVGDLTVAVGTRLALPPARMEVLRRAGRLHDVGKIGVPNNILRKPGALTHSEFEIIKQHTVRGGRLAENSKMLAEVAPIIRAHHERLDGRGYPDGLKGDEIPYEARIVAVADVWDALTSHRPYRAAMKWQEAAQLLAAGAGTHLDPDCVEALLSVLGLPDLRRFLDGDLPEAGRAAA